MLTINPLRKIAVYLAAALLCLSTARSQTPSISLPSTITFTQGIENTPVAITNSGGAVPSTLFGKPEVVPTTGVVPWLKPLVKSSDGSFYGGVMNATYSTTVLHRISSDGRVSVYAGSSTEGYVDGPAASARFMNIISIAADASGNLYLTELNSLDADNSRVRKISGDGMVSTFATGLKRPKGIAVDAAGLIYVVEASWIRKFKPDGTYIIFAGKIGPGYENGQGTAASFTNPDLISFDKLGNLYVYEESYNLRMVSPSGLVSQVRSPFPARDCMVIDNGGNFWVSSGSGSIQRIPPSGLSSLPISFGAGPVAIDGDYVYFTYENKFQRMPVFGYSVDPAFQAGISLNPNGTISGSPQWLQEPWNYTVTAHNVYGSSSATVKYNTIMQAVPPVITSFTPTSAVGGSTITINGSHFSGATAVSIGGVPVKSFQLWSFDKINVVMAAGTPSGEIKVTNAYGSGTLGGFTVIPPPVVSSFSPSSAMNGQVITITGENFSDISSIYIGNSSATSFKVISTTAIEATVGFASNGNITVSGSAGMGSKEGFIFISPPVINSFTSSGGMGSEITINGSGFSGATSVKFGATGATSFTVVSPTVIKAIVGSGSSGDITITTPAGTGTKSGFTWISAPLITSIHPTTAKTGDYINILGSNLQNATVSFGGLAASSVYSSPSSISARVGEGASGDITITTPGGTVIKSGFTFIGSPTISSFSPVSGRKGDMIVITGTNFKPDTKVAFGSFPAQQVNIISSSKIEATIGSGGSGDITVTDAGGTSSIAGFIHTGPRISSFNPQLGDMGTAVTITGLDFTRVTGVTFGGVPAASFTVNSTTSITAVAGKGQTGNISVITDYGTAVSSEFFRHSAPSIRYLSNQMGYAGLKITITGIQFTGVTSVSFGDVPAASFTVISDTHIEAELTNTGASGDVVIQSPAGLARISGFVYIFPPTISSISPDKAGFQERITITGSSFYNVSSVKIGSTQFFPESYTATSIVIVIPEISLSGNITVTTPAGSVTGGVFSHSGPRISSFTPVSAPAGHTVTITGENFTGVTEVNFGTVAAASFSVLSDTEIKAVLSTYAGTTLQLKSPKGSVSKPGFSFIFSPDIQSFSPQRAGAGVPVTINGNNFIDVSSVTFGGVPAQSVEVKSIGQIIAQPSAGASGSIEITTIAGKTSKSGFEWFPKPAITSFHPAKAATGDTVTIIGKNLSSTLFVNFGKAYSISPITSSDSLITVKVGSAETGEITVGTPGGTTSIPGFTFILPPTISSFTVSGEGTGATVIIKGTNFADVRAVKFGVIPAASFTVNSATEITAVAGDGESGSISVITSGGAASKNGYIHYKPPYIASFSPASGPVGTVLTIAGANFNHNPADNKVYFGSMKATVLTATATELKVTVPAYGVSLPIRILNAGSKMSGFSGEIFRLTYPQISPAPANLFPNLTELPLQDVVSNVAVADFDEDGKNDLIVTTGSPQATLLIYRNSLSDGLAASSFATTTPLQIKPASFLTYGLGDVNGDGLTDIVCSITSKIIIYKNTSTPGNISFSADTIASGYWGLDGALTVKDLDLDGKCDILAGGVFRRNTSSFAPGTPLTFAAGQGVSILGGGSYSNPAWQDIDGDRKLDLIMSDSYGPIKVAKNTSSPGNIGTSSFQEQTSLPSSLYNSSNCYAVDLDGDNKPEIVEAGGDAYFTVLHNKHSAGPIAETSFSAPKAINLTLGYGVNPWFTDLDGDTKPDIVFASGSSIRMFKNLSSAGSFSFSDKPLFSTGNYPGAVYLSSVAIGDLDGDGKPEVITTNSTNYKIIILHSNPGKSPAITAFSPTAAAADSTVTISGHNLSNTTAVSFGGQPATSFKVISHGTISAVVGSGASGDVTIISDGITLSKSGFSLVTLPSISAFSPAVVTQGTLVTITGTNFSQIIGVTFGKTAAASFHVVSPTSITAVVGQGTSGEVSILTAAGNVSKAGFFFIPKPQITALGQTTFASGGSVQLTTNPVTDYIYSWQKNGVTVPGAISASFTASETGSYTVTIESNSVKSTSALLYVTAVYVLPPSNFKVQLISETCKDSNNGTVLISTLKEEDYTAIIIGNNKTTSYPFRSSKEITGLSSGEYEICIRVAGQQDFSRCFNVIVTEPENFSFTSSVDNSRYLVSLNMKGSNLYTIELNGKIYQTANTDIELPLKPGSNKLSVWTDKDCQGRIMRTIEMPSGPSVYPNPFEKELFVVSKQGKSARIEVRNLEGKLLYSALHKSENETYLINLEHLTQGIYLLRASSENSVDTYKIIKR